MTDISIDNLLAKAKNKFLLVNAAASRAKQVSEGSLPYIDNFDPTNPVITALREIAADKIRIRVLAGPTKKAQELLVAEEEAAKPSALKRLAKEKEPPPRRRKRRRKRSRWLGPSTSSGQSGLVVRSLAMLQGKTIILGVTGCIAAYKSATVVSRLKDLGAEVWVAMTKEATQLVGPLTFRTLSGNPVITDLFAQEVANFTVPHVSLAEKADLVVIAPCTANIIGKIAYGIADDALTTMVMASKARKLIAPAMNCNMWRNPMVVKNVEKLKELKWEFVGPVEGKLACGEEDIGRMAEPEEIVEKIVELLVPKQDLKGKHFLVTAGGTREAIDPVRYISNRSSGKMGYTIAQAARERGASVVLISANVNLPSPLDIKPIKVESATGMLEAVLDYYNNADAVIMVAAVADYTPKVQSPKSKVKKSEKELKLALDPTTDILKTIAKQKGRKGRKLIGFALETEDLIKNAKLKMQKKDLDVIVANGPDSFGSDSAKVTIIGRNGKIEELPLLSKLEVAHKILNFAF